MYSLCTMLSYVNWQTWYIQILKIINMYIHVYTFVQMLHVCTWYVHAMYIQRYKRVCTLFRHVCTCLYYYIQVLNHVNMYIQCTNMYIKCCVVYRWLHTFHGMYWHCWTWYVHWYILLAAAFLIRPAGWPVGWDWPVLPGVTPIQVQAHEFNRHQPEALQVAFLPPAPFRPRSCPPELGAGGGSSPSHAGLAAVAGLAASAASASGASLVLELALDHLGLGATAGAHNPLDILVKGCHDGLQLRREGVRLHFGVYIHHSTLVPKCLCIHAVLKIE